jgi:sugar lactone lactonase YvrE
MEGAPSRGRFWKRCLCGLAALGLFLVATGQARPDFIYWSDAGRGEIRRANLDGTEMTTLVSRLSFPSGPALDFAGGMIWADFTGGDLRRANLDGTGETTLIKLGAPFAPVLDLAGGQMYWTDWGNSNGGFGLGSIQRANLDGTGQTTLVSGLTSPNHVAVDLAGGKMYWGNNIGAPEIQRANLDGSGQEILVPNAGDPVSWITLDVAHGQMYWSNFGGVNGTIRRANLDGSGQEVLVRNVNSPIGIALDVAGGKMYWADFYGQDIQRANLDGTDQEILITGLFEPSGIALDLGTPGTAVFYALAAPTSVPSGTAFDLTITAADPYGAIDVHYQGTVTFATSDTDPGIVLPADYIFTAYDHGVHTFSGAVTLSTPGDQTITVTDTASGMTRTVTVTVVAPN